jgi:Protein phosphatase 2C
VSDGWLVFGASVRGAAHERAGTPNQDAIGWLPESGRGLPLGVVVSDGHGSAKCFRSGAGAAMAVEATIALFEVLAMSERSSTLDEWRAAAEQQLRSTLPTWWAAKVDEALAREPISEAELAPLDASERADVLANPYVAYGATLLGVLVTARCTLFAKLGDGDIVTVAHDGAIERPMPTDRRLIANETTSLSGRSAIDDLVIRVTPGEQRPRLILTSSDGYANSFATDADFLRAAPDIAQMVNANGPDEVATSLPGWLRETSREGSGDDITVGVVCNVASGATA